MIRSFCPFFSFASFSVFSGDCPVSGEPTGPITTTVADYFRGVQSTGSGPRFAETEPRHDIASRAADFSVGTELDCRIKPGATDAGANQFLRKTSSEENMGV